MPETFMCYAGKIYHLTYERSIILHLHLLRQIPLIHSVYSLFYINLMLPSQTMQFAYIRQLAHSAVGLRSVKSQFALIAHFFDNLIRQLSMVISFPVPILIWQLRISLEPGVYVSLKSTCSMI